MRTRSGITLVEVLVAIFIMGVGLLAILVLFPVGALKMAQAIRDDRAAHAGHQAAAVANMWDLRHNQAVETILDQVPGGWPPPLAHTPSYPVVIDPFGGALLSAPLGARAGATPGLLRVVPAQGNGVGQIPVPANNASAGDRWFTLNDDLNFNADGTPFGTPGVSVQRYGSYTWAYLARRPQHGNKSTVDLSVIVYKGRPVLTPNNEPTFAVTGAKDDTALTVTVTAGSEPEIRTGGWLLDTTAIPAIFNGVQVRTVAALAYQVTDIQKAGTTWTVRVEPPLRNNVDTVAFLENAIAVFEKGTGWLP